MLRFKDLCFARKETPTTGRDTTNKKKTPLKPDAHTYKYKWKPINAKRLENSIKEDELPIRTAAYLIIM